MPELCRFRGVVIQMYFYDHAPPHFHARFNELSVQIAIRDFALIGGSVPPRILGMIVEWASLHQDELLAAWELARHGQAPGPIAPLP